VAFFLLVSQKPLSERSCIFPYVSWRALRFPWRRKSNLSQARNPASSQRGELRIFLRALFRFRNELICASSYPISAGNFWFTARADATVQRDELGHFWKTDGTGPGLRCLPADSTPFVGAGAWLSLALLWSAPISPRCASIASAEGFSWPRYGGRREPRCRALRLDSLLPRAARCDCKYMS